MKIAVISDIHGNLFALEAVTQDLEQRGVDAVVNLGDSLSGPLLPLETAQFLMARGWLHLAGNHERQVLTGGPGIWNASDEYTHAQLTPKELAWLAELAPTAMVGREVFLCHGIPSNDKEYLLETLERDFVRTATNVELAERLSGLDAKVILCGHSHLPRSMRSAIGQLLVNPGSVGLPAFDATRPRPHVMQSGSVDASYAIVEQRRGAWLAELLSVPYPHLQMAKLAAERGRASWAQALATGYVR
jgi:putative phosphoesterase